MGRNRRHVVFTAVLLFLLPLAVGAQDISEQQLKAAFLYRFLPYIEWSRVDLEDNAAVVFGVLGEDTVAESLQQLAAGQVIDGRPIEVRRLGVGDALAGLHVLFIGRTSPGNPDAVLQTAMENGVLTVTETEGQRASLSMINFEVSDNRVRFDVALVPVEQAGLQLSSRLLQVARRVIDTP